MSHNIEVVSELTRKISVVVSVDDVNAAITSAAREVGASVTLPGFRKGKAPASVIEKRFADEVIGRATEVLVERRVADIIKAEDLKPMSRLDFEGDKIVRGQELAFSFTFEILPEVKLPEDLSALSVEMESAEPTEEEIEAFTKRLLKSAATLEDVNEDRLAVPGDVVTIDVDGDVEGKPVPGMKVANYNIQLVEPTEGQELSELDKIIRSLKPGEEGTGSMVCPEDHVDESLRGKTVDLRVKLHKISREILPELNDELAQKFGFPKLDILKYMIAKQTAEAKAERVRTDAEQKIMEQVLAGQEFPLPEAVLKTQRAEYEAEVREFLEKQGMDKEGIEGSLKNMTEEVEEQTKERARMFVFLAALAHREKLEVTAQEVDVQIMKMARQYNQDYVKFREALYQTGSVNDIQDRMLNSKALAYMLDKAQKTAPEAKAE